MSKLIRFKTRFGDRVMGGYSETIRTPSSTEELNTPLTEVSQNVLDLYEKQHLEAVNQQRFPWGLPTIHNFD